MVRNLHMAVTGAAGQDSSPIDVERVVVLKLLSDVVRVLKSGLVDSDPKTI